MKTFTFKKMAMLGIAMYASVAFVKAQDEVELTAGADIVSKYVWRGANQGQGAAFQPALGIGYKGLSLSAWGSTGFANPYAYEFDISVGYSFGSFSILLTDYYWDGHDGFYGYYKDSHHLEGALAFTVSESVPFTLSVATMLAFYDPSLKDDAGEDDRNYSTYINAGYDFSIGDGTLSASIGVTPWGSALWGSGKNKFEIADISFKGSKELKITESFSLPVFSQVIFSPATDSAHLVFGLSF